MKRTTREVWGLDHRVPGDGRHVVPAGTLVYTTASYDACGTPSVICERVDSGLEFDIEAASLEDAEGVTCPECGVTVTAPTEPGLIHGCDCARVGWFYGDGGPSVVPSEAGSTSVATLAVLLLALVPVSLVAVFVASLAGAVAGVTA